MQLHTREVGWISSDEPLRHQTHHSMAKMLPKLPNLPNRPIIPVLNQYRESEIKQSMSHL